MGAEIAFEKFAVALEATRGTAVTPPTHDLNAEGMLTPKKTRSRKPMTDGTLAEIRRSVVVRKWGEWEAEAEADVNTLPVFANMAVQGNVTSPTTPAGATNSRLWTFTREMTTDNLESGTFYFGDPNVKVFQGAYGMLDELGLTGDASGEDAVTMSLKGMTKYPAKLGSVPTFPALAAGPILTPGTVQVWIDTASAFGTTEITGRVISAELTSPTGVSYKYKGQGPTGDRSYSGTGRGKAHPTMTLVLELADLTQYDQWDDDETRLKIRVRFSGALIEAGFYNYVQWDIYGPIDTLDWGSLEDTNRTIELTVEGEYESGMGSDLKLYIQNARNTL